MWHPSPLIILVWICWNLRFPRWHTSLTWTLTILCSSCQQVTTCWNTFYSIDMILELQFYFQSPNYDLVWSWIISSLLMGFFPFVDIHSIQIAGWYRVFFVVVRLISFWLFLQLKMLTLSEHMSIVLHKVIMNLVLVIKKTLLHWSIQIFPIKWIEKLYPTHNYLPFTQIQSFSGWKSMTSNMTLVHAMWRPNMVLQIRMQPCNFVECKI